jgi:hypothetical protein
MSISFLMPMVCFAAIAVYGYLWSRLSKTDSRMEPSAGVEQ